MGFRHPDASRVALHKAPSTDIRGGKVCVSDLADSWEIALRAEHKSPQTIASYTTGVRLHLEWLADRGLPDEINRRAVQAWVGDLLDAGAEASTARARQLAVRRFSNWLTEEGEIPADPLLGLKPPKVDDKVVEPLTDGQIVALLATCGRDFIGVRDQALIRLMVESGVRAGEVIAMDVDDLDVKAGSAIVRRGKGGRGRLVPFGPKTAAALDRYLRLRRQHKFASSPRLWLGHRGSFEYGALRKTLGLRAQTAGIPNFHLHRLRNTAATRWLAKGGSEGGLLAVAGWKQRSMLDRYVAATASARAAEEARGLNLGEL